MYLKYTIANLLNFSIMEGECFRDSFCPEPLNDIDAEADLKRGEHVLS